MDDKIVSFVVPIFLSLYNFISNHFGYILIAIIAFGFLRTIAQIIEKFFENSEKFDNLEKISETMNNIESSLNKINDILSDINYVYNISRNAREKSELEEDNGSDFALELFARRTREAREDREKLELENESSL